MKHRVLNFLVRAHARIQPWLSDQVLRLRRVEGEIRTRLKAIPYWIAGIAVGLIAFFYSATFSKSIDLVQHLLATHPYALLLIGPCAFVAATWLVVRFAPYAGGASVSHVQSVLDLELDNSKAAIEEVLGVRVGLVVLASSLLAVLGGGGLGREGPMVHVGACLFYAIGRMSNVIWPAREHGSWVVAGAASGIAAAFNAPLAGVVFVLEELSQLQFNRFKTVVLTAAIIGGVVSQWLSGKYLFFGYPPIGSVGLDSIPIALLLGLVCGSIAIVFHRASRWSIENRGYFFRSRPLRFAAFCGLTVAAVAVFIEPLSAGGGVLVVSNLLFQPDNHASWNLVLGRFLSTWVSSLSGCAGGLLAPSLALGASIGSKFSQLIHHPNHGLLVIVGMASFLSATMRAPFTAWVIVMEMTSRNSAIFPLMVASLTSWVTVKFWDDWSTKPGSLSLHP